MHHRFNFLPSVPEQRPDERTTTLDLRCISWLLQASLDKAFHVTAFKYLLSIPGLAYFDPILSVECFNIFIGCINVSDEKVTVTQGLEQLAAVSARCFFRTFHYLSVMDPTSSILKDLRSTYDKIFPLHTDFSNLPFYRTMTTISILVNTPWKRHDIRWGDSRSSAEELVPFARHMVEAAQLEYRRMQYRKVPRWILRFALSSLSLDPPPAESVVSDCLTIVAIDLDCEISTIATSEERYVQILQISTFLTKR